MKAKFSIGQRVRLVSEAGYYYVSTEDCAVPVGAVGTVVVGKDWAGDYEVMFDSFPCPTPNDPAWFVKESYLEPVYDGDEKASWNECTWKPDEHRVNIALSETSGIESSGYKG